jgi:type I restriction enzyme S subunit
VIVTLGSAGATYGGLTGKSGKDFGHGQGRYVAFTEVMADARLVGNSLERVDVRKGERQNEVSRGDVLFNGSSETPEEVALGAVVDFDVPQGVYLNSFCFGYRLTRPGLIDPTYLSYFFRSSVGREIVSGLAQGSTRYNIAKAKLLRVPLSLPSFEEQNAAATALTQVDDLIAQIALVIAKKRAIKQGMMQELLTGRTRLPGFSGEWRVRRLGEVLKFQVGYPFSSGYFTDVPSGVRLVRNRDLRAEDAVVYYAGPFASEYLLADNDMLVGMDGDFEPVIWRGGRALLNQRVGRLRMSTAASDSFLSHALVRPLKTLEGETGATTVKHLSHQDVESIAMPLPSRDEQDAIGRVLDDAEAEVFCLEARLTATCAIKRGMMQELLTGRTRLVPTEAPA